MRISYDSEFWQIYVELTDANIQTLQEKKELRDEAWFLFVDPKQQTHEPIWDPELPTKILGITIAQTLFDLFVETCKNPQNRSALDRIGTSLSVELIRIMR